MYSNPSVQPEILWEGATFTAVWQVIDPATGNPATAPAVTGAVTLPDGTAGGAMVVTATPEDLSTVRASFATTTGGTHAFVLTSATPTQKVQGVAIARAAAVGVTPIELDPTTPIGQIRLLIGDINEAAALFTDAQLGAFQTMGGGNKFLAAALALETIASSEALISKKITTQDLQTDGPAVAEALRKLAERMRKNADEIDDAGDVFAAIVVPFDPHCPSRW